MAVRPTTATIKFHSDRHIEVEFDDIRFVTPRSIAIAENLLQVEFRRNKAKFNAKMHKQAREQKAADDAAAAKQEDEFHEMEDERLLAAAAAKLNKAEKDNDKSAKEREKRVSARLAEAAKKVSNKGSSDESN